MLGVKAKDQGHKRKCSPKKRPSKKLFQVCSTNYGLKKFFQPIYKILNIQKIALSSSRGLEALRPRPRTRPSRPRPRTLKCVFEDVLEAKHVLEDTTFVIISPNFKLLALAVSEFLCLIKKTLIETKKKELK